MGQRDRQGSGLRRNRRQTAQDVDGIGQLIILIPQLGRFLDARALFFSPSVIEAFDRMPRRSDSCWPLPSVSAAFASVPACVGSTAGWFTTMSGITPRAWIDRPDGV